MRVLLVLFVFTSAFCVVDISDNQGNGTVPNVLANIIFTIIILWPLSGSGGCRNSSCHTHLKNYLFIFLMLNVPFFFNLLCVSTSWPMQSKQITRRQKKNREKKQKKTEDIINSDLTLGLWRDLAHETKPLTQPERLQMASDNEEH